MCHFHVPVQVPPLTCGKRGMCQQCATHVPPSCAISQCATPNHRYFHCAFTSEYFTYWSIQLRAEPSVINPSTACSLRARILALSSG